MLAVDTSKIFTYQDYLSWNDDERWELIYGEAYNMSPAPTTKHQRISGSLSYRIYSIFENSNCEVFVAPFDVRLSSSKKKKLNQKTNDNDITTVVQPDIVVICEQKKIDDKGCIGAPDLVIEILSPSTAYKDTTTKLKLYEENQIKEYWVVNPEAEYIMVYSLVGDKYTKPEYLRKDDTLKSKIFNQVEFEVEKIFE